MDVANNWTIVIGMATLVSMVFLLSKKGYLDPIRQKELAIISKVKTDLSIKLEASKKVIEEKGEEKFVDEIYDIIQFRKVLRELKEIFGRRMIPMGLSACVITVLLVSLWQYHIAWLNGLIFYLGIILVAVVAGDFLRMRKNERLLSRYWEGEDPSRILREEK